MQTAKTPSRTEIKHKAILEAAKGVFLKNGYLATSMDEVAKQANVSKRTIYDQFGNKKELFESMLMEHWNQVFAQNGNLFNENETIANNLKFFATIFLKFLYQQDTIDLFRLLIAEANRFPDLTDQLTKQGKAPFTAALIQFLDKSKKANQLKIRNAEQAAAQFMGLLKEDHFWPMMLGFTKKRKPSNVSQLIDEAVELFTKAYK